MDARKPKISKIPLITELTGETESDVFDVTDLSDLMRNDSTLRKDDLERLLVKTADERKISVSEDELSEPVDPLLQPNVRFKIPFLRDPLLFDDDTPRSNLSVRLGLCLSRTGDESHIRLLQKELSDWKDRSVTNVRVINVTPSILERRTRLSPRVNAHAKRRHDSRGHGPTLALPSLEHRESGFSKFQRIAKLVMNISGICLALKSYVKKTEAEFWSPQEMYLHVKEDLDKLLAFNPQNFSKFQPPKREEKLQRLLHIPPSQRTPHHLKTILAFIRTNSSFQDYPANIQIELCKRLIYQKYEARRIILKQGHPPSAFYFLLSGTLIVNIRDVNSNSGKTFLRTAAQLTPGDCFGMKLMTVDHFVQHCPTYQEQRKAVWPLDIPLNEKLFGPMEKLRKTAAFVRATGVPVRAFDEDETRCRHIVQELALLEEKARTATIICKTCVELAAISKQDFHEIIRKPLLRQRRQHIQFCQSTQVFKDFPCETFALKPDDFFYQYIPKNKIIIKDTRKCKYLIAIKSGKCFLVGEFCHNPTQSHVAKKRDVAMDLEKAFPYYSEMRKLNNSSNRPKTESAVDATSHFRDSLEVGLLTGVVDKSNLEKQQDQRKPQVVSRTAHKPATKARPPLHKSRTMSNFYDCVERERRQSQMDGGSDQTDRRFWGSRLNGPVSYKSSAKRRQDSSISIRLRSSKSRSRNSARLVDKDRQMFAQVACFTQGAVFGLESLVERPLTSLSLISDGAECLFISKELFLKEANIKTLRVVNDMVMIYPSQVFIRDQVNVERKWVKFKEDLVREIISLKGRHD